MDTSRREVNWYNHTRWFGWKATRDKGRDFANGALGDTGRRKISKLRRPEGWVGVVIGLRWR